ncbi:MAG: hypothetical protein FIA99_05450 [Ruminiclostridium sp.]|nr:hypothetical protein [Ruminiclostridium sp.]
MAKITGYLPAAADFTSRITQIKDLFTTYLSDVFTFDSDTGTGNSRILKYVMPGTTRKFQFYYSGAGLMYLRNLADSTVLGGFTTTPHSSVCNYTIIKNTNSGCLFFNDVANGFIWCTVAGTTKCTGGQYIYSLYPTTGSDASMKYFSSSSLGSYTAPIGQFDDGREIFLPSFIMNDDNTTILSGAVPDIFAFANTQSLVAGASFTVDSTEYFITHGKTCIRVNA